MAQLPTNTPAAGSGRVTQPYKQGASRDELAELIDAYIERDGRSLNRIAQAALVDVAYLWRLRSGEKHRPSRDILIRLGLALKLEPEELDELLIAADYAPITLRRL
jgi:transcriptional regulator with XRE-family HTH domain